MRTNTHPQDYYHREFVSSEDLDRTISQVDAALKEYRALFNYKNLHELNYDKTICLMCGVIVLAHEGRLWEMTDTRDGAVRFAVFCIACHDTMIITPEELASEADYRDLKDTENCARATL